MVLARRLLLAGTLLVAAGSLHARPGQDILFPGDVVEGSVVPRFLPRRRQHRLSRPTDGGFFFPGEEPQWTRPSSGGDEAVLPGRAPPRPDRRRWGWTVRPTSAPAERTPEPPAASADPDEAARAPAPAVIVDTPAPRPASLRPSPGGITFEDGPAAPLRPLPRCGGEPYQAYNNATGECQQLWTGDNCPDGYWFVVDRNSGDAGCRPRPCPAGQALFAGQCRPSGADANGSCPAGMVVFLDEFGHGFCDCRALHVYWPAERLCFQVFRRGPCAAGQHVMLPANQTSARCLPTPCADDEALWREDEAAEPACFAINEYDRPCADGRLIVGVDTLQLECVHLGLTAIFDLPKVRCAPGSMLDFQGQCREELFQKFRSGFRTVAVPEAREFCPAGFHETPDGRCVNKELDGLGGGGRNKTRNLG